MLKPIQHPERLVALFQGFTYNYLPDAVLEGHTGAAWADDEGHPQVGVLGYPDVGLFFVGGDAGHPAARAYLAGIKPPIGLIFASPGWEELVRALHPSRLLVMPRYAFTSEKLDPERLRTQAARRADGYRLEPIDLPLAQRIAAEKSGFTSAHLINFQSPEDFIARGFGCCILKGNEMACIASTFAVCRKGIEIQIDTRESHQRKGLATAAAAQLILQSLERGLDPNWDADNVISCRLAEKLGYTPQGQYSMTVILKSRMIASFAKAMIGIKHFFKR